MMPLPETRRITLGERTDPNRTVTARTEAQLTGLGQDAFRLTIRRYLLDRDGKVIGQDAVLLDADEVAALLAMIRTSITPPAEDSHETATETTPAATRSSIGWAMALNPRHEPTGTLHFLVTDQDGNRGPLCGCRPAAFGPTTRDWTPHGQACKACTRLEVNPELRTSRRWAPDDR